jgi:hypothetical protein
VDSYILGMIPQSTEWEAGWVADSFRTFAEEQQNLLLLLLQV